jgi:NADH-quinone oxidoreductase subunit L
LRPRSLERVKGPFYMLVFGALLTAFYMTRQVSYVFFGVNRGDEACAREPRSR